MQIVTDFLFSHDMLTAVTGGVIANLLISLFWALPRWSSNLLTLSVSAHEQ